MKHYPVILVTLILACGGSSPDRDAGIDTLATSTPTHPVQPDTPVTAAAVDSGAPRLLPIDQADASFRAFRERALQGLSQHDTTFLYSILASEIKNSFGGDDSIAGFKRIWHMSSPDTRVWTALSRVLKMGGKLEDSTFTAGYVFGFWPNQIDAFEHVAVTEKSAPVRALAEAAAPVLGIASYSILKFEDWKNLGESAVATENTWARVQLPDKRSVWLKGTDVYSPVGWRAIFEKRAGQWVMVIFVAGD